MGDQYEAIDTPGGAPPPPAEAPPPPPAEAGDNQYEALGGGDGGAAPPPPADPPVVQPAQNDQQSKPGSKENKAAVDPNYAKLARTDLRTTDENQAVAPAGGGDADVNQNEDAANAQPVPKNKPTVIVDTTPQYRPLPCQRVCIILTTVLFAVFGLVITGGVVTTYATGFYGWQSK